MLRVNKYGCSKVTVFGPVGCIAAKNKQIIISMGAGANAALNAFDY